MTDVKYISGHPICDVTARAALAEKADTDDVESLTENIAELQDGGYVADQQKIAEKINDWLEEHPEATTTVQDGAVTEVKLSGALKLKTIKDYVTPEMYGAVGNGVADDSAAIQSAFNSGKNILCAGTYRITEEIVFGSGTGSTIGYGKKRVVVGDGRHLYKYNTGEIEMLLSDATFVFDGGYFHPTYVAQTTFRDCVFMGDPTTTSTEKAFYKTSGETVSHLLIHTCTFLNFDKAINFEHGSIWSGENEIKGCFFGNCNYCLYDQRLVDSYVCENIVHASCQHAFYGIGGGTFFKGNHDYSCHGTLATGGYFIGNYFDGLNLLTVGISDTIGYMIINSNYFLYNSKITDVEQGCINVAHGLIDSVICGNVIRTPAESASLKVSLIKMLSSNGPCHNNVINNNQFSQGGHSIISTPNIGTTLYYANQCDAPIAVTVTPADSENTTYKVFDSGNETTIIFTLTAHATGTLIGFDFGDGNVNAITGAADYDIMNATTGAFITRKISFARSVIVYANELPGVDYANDGIKVAGRITFNKMISQSNVRQNYARLRTD